MSDYVDIRFSQGAGHNGILEPTDDPATVAVNAIFADLRDRRFLKWLFDGSEHAAPVAEGIERIDLDVQQDIATTWREIIRRAHAEKPHDQ